MVASVRVVASETDENFRCLGGRMGRIRELLEGGEYGDWAVPGIW